MAEPTRQPKTWQDELSEECRRRNLAAPVYNIVSDRRGGRTAWSATVTVNAQNIAARYWYDGVYLNNAKEDAAEVACTRLRSPSIASPPGQDASTGRGPSGFDPRASGTGGQEQHPDWPDQ